MYLNIAEEEDIKMAESWKGDAEGLLVFTGLFSAAVAALLAVTVQDIRPNSQDISAFYLATISHQLALLNGTLVPIPSSLSNPAVSFTPPTWSVWVNGLWFMSLVISLTCAVLATLLQQWARRYLRVAYPRYSPFKRARIRAFYANGVDKLHLPWMVEALPALLHISLFLFFAGLAVFVFNVNLTIFKFVIVWIGLCVLAYAYLTILPIRHKNSPYAGPLSSSVSFCLTGIRFAFFRLVEKFPGHVSSIIMQLRNRNARVTHVDDFFSHSMTKTAEQFAFQQGPEIDFGSLLWTFESLDEDKEVEKFFEGVPGLCGSKAVKNAQLGFFKRGDNETKFSSALIELMNRTLSSNLVSETVKRRRIIICTKVIDATSLLGPWWILRRVLLGDWERFLECVEFGLFVKNWRSITHRVTTFYAECVAAVTISSVQDRDDRWFQLASGPLGTFKNHFQNYIQHRDSILLANAIFIVQRTIQTYSGSAERHRDDILGASTKTLESLRSKLDIRNTLPELQHQFCHVWNKLVDLAQHDKRPHIVCVSKATLENIRELSIALHEDPKVAPMAFSNATDDRDPGFDKPTSYCMCTVDKHLCCEKVPDLIIEEPAPDVPLAPDVPPGIPPSHSRPPQHFPIPSPHLRTTNPQPTHHSASRVDLQAPVVHATSPVAQDVPTFPVPRGIPTVPFLHGTPNEGLPSAASSLRSNSSSSLDHKSTGVVSPGHHTQSRGTL